MNKLIGALCVNYGALAGANFMTSGNGIVFRGLMEEVGYGEMAFSYSTTIFAASFILPVIVISGLLLLSKKNAMDATLNIEKPERFDKTQKTNLYLIFTMMAIVLIAPILNTIFKDNLKWMLG